MTLDYFLLQINIYMTHMGNYANDRLALYTFESVIKFVKCWTNLKLKQVTPLEMGIKYFEMYPEDKEPVWQVRTVEIVYNLDRSYRGQCQN